MKPKIKLKPIINLRTKGINEMAKKIANHRNDIWCPVNKLKTKIIKQKTWFTIKESTSPNQEYFKENVYDVVDEKEVEYCAKRIYLKLTSKQKVIINEWLNTYLKMYNIALKYIKHNIKTNKKVLNFIYLRKLLMKEKNKLLQTSSIKVHDVDYAIKLVCQNYKAAHTNYKLGNIKYFRMRYWKSKKENKMMDLEKMDFNKKGIRSAILGDVKGYYNGEMFNFESIKCDCRLQKKEGEYYLYVPEPIVFKKDKTKKNKQITIDPGIRRFCTGITENKIIKIGEKSGKRIEKYLRRKDKILKNENINIKIKKKNEKMINKKIVHLVNELHWKTIDYLTKNNKIILIGDMSSKSIVSKKGNLTKMTKRIALHLKFFEFRERLKYKCNIKKIGYGQINEWMTSKMCSMCGHVEEDLGGNEMYECTKCGIKMERDINGARNIHIKAII